MTGDPMSEQREPEPQGQRPAGVSRRRLFGWLGAGTAGVLAAGATGGVIGRTTALETASASEPGPDDAVAFDGEHQAGIVTPAQDRLHFVSFDVITDDRDELVEMLKAWTAAARRMTAGRDAGPIGAVDGERFAPPDDTGEAIGLPPSGLTLTIGFGPTLFQAADGADRFGLAARRPAPLAELPAFAGDQLDPAISGGDICIQACANDPQVAVHAVRNLVRLGAGVVSVRWSQLGFGRTSSTSTGQATPRNLFGFKDGTNNLKAENEHALDRFVWVADGDSGADWLAGGSYLVTRRIRMLVEPWDTSTSRRSSTRSTSPRRWTASSRSPRPRTSSSPTRPTRGRRSCGAATASSTGPTASAGWTRDCSSSPTSATRRPGSYRSSGTCGWTP
jgi:deferrochelatase/peroxidase EfeB